MRTAVVERAQAIAEDLDLTHVKAWLAESPNRLAG